MKLVRWLAVSALALVTAAALLSAWAWRTLHRPYQGYPGSELRVDIEPGQNARSILAQLELQGVLASADLARFYLVYGLHDPPLKAGEYRLSGPATTPEVLARLIRGEVVTYPVTLVEGWTLEETARHLADQGFGEYDELTREMRSPEGIADLDQEASDLEGYLYPDTYSFARGTPEREVVGTLVRTFRGRFDSEILPLLEADDGRSVRQLVTLASIVEKEAGLNEERPLIAGVFANRIRRGIALHADPTVIYALKLLGRWDGNIRRPDLELDSPYNTYRYPGLPPGPIASPGLASLEAAARPAEVPYLYFVSRNDGSHVFATTLAEHNRNVYTWQKDYWRRRRAEEKRRAGGE